MHKMQCAIKQINHLKLISHAMIYLFIHSFIQSVSQVAQSDSKPISHWLSQSVKLLNQSVTDWVKSVKLLNLPISQSDTAVSQSSYSISLST